MPIIQHILQLILFWVILIGPLPLCVAVLFFIDNKKDKSSFSHNLLVLITCWCIIETSIGLLLGMSHHLTFSAVLLAEILIFISGIIFIIYMKLQSPSIFIRNFLQFPKGLNIFEKLIIGVLCFIGLVLLWVVMTCPIREYDSLAYHLPTMAKWYQTGILHPFEQNVMIARYPYNWEVLCTLFLMPFREDFPVAFPNLIAWLALGLSVYLLSLKIGAKRIHGLTVSALVLILPIVLLNVNTMHIDLPLASFFMIGLYFIVSYFQRRTFCYLSLFLAALGMLLGIKTSGLVYGFLLIIIFVVMWFKSVYFNKKPINFSLRPYKLVIPFNIWCILSCLLLGGFWYLRNFFELGNPLGYIKVQIANIVVFPGPINPGALYNTTLANTFNFTDLSHWKILSKQVELQLGIPFFVMIFLVLFLLFAAFTAKISIKKFSFLGIMALLMSTFVLYWTTPFSGCNTWTKWPFTPWFGQAIRYAFPFIGVLGIASAAGAKIIRPRSAIFAVIVIISCFPGITQLTKRFGLEGNSTLYIAILLLVICEVDRALAVNKRRLYKLSVLVIIPLIIAASFFARQERDRKRTKFYGGVCEYVENNIKQDEVIGYLCSHRSYLFYGKKLNRKVKYVPAKSRNLSQWLNFLRSEGIKVIIVGPLNKRWEKRKELKWLENNKTIFIHVFGNKPTRIPKIYRLKNINNAGQPPVNFSKFF